MWPGTQYENATQQVPSAAFISGLTNTPVLPFTEVRVASVSPFEEMRCN